jgi:hypothetical protein
MMYLFQLKNKNIPKMSLFMETSIPTVIPNYSYTPRKNNVVFRSRVFKKSMIQIVNEPINQCGCK